MPTLLEYARIADKVYEPSTSASPGIDGYTCPPGKAVDDAPFHRGGSAFTSGFQGRLFVEEGGNNVVVAYKGTVPSMAADLTADLAIVMSAVPRQAQVALRNTQRWIAGYRTRRITIVGHSLGGGLAQIVGITLGLRFVTFNAPGMLDNLHGVAPGIPAGRFLRLLGLGYRNAGVNYRRSWDVVGNFGAHIGRRVEVPGGNTGLFSGHGITGFVEVLQTYGDRNKDPLAPLEAEEA